MKSFLEYANAPMIWVCCSVTVIIMVVQVLLFRKAALATADVIQMPKEKTNLAFRTGIVSGIGPALGIFVVIVGVIGSIGSPMSWLRCSVIGSAGTELYGASIGAQVMGTTLGAEDYDLTCMALSWLCMALNACGWMLVVGFCTPLLGKFRDKMGGGNQAWIGMFSLATCIGMFGYLTESNAASGMGPAAAAIGGAIIMALLNKFVAPKFPKMGEFSLGIAMIAGIAAGLVLG